MMVGWLRGGERGRLVCGGLVFLTLFASIEIGLAGVGYFLSSGTLVSLRFHPAIQLG